MTEDSNPLLLPKQAEGLDPALCQISVNSRAHQHVSQKIVKMVIQFFVTHVDELIYLLKSGTVQ